MRHHSTWTLYRQIRKKNIEKAISSTKDYKLTKLETRPFFLIKLRKKSYIDIYHLNQNQEKSAFLVEKTDHVKSLKMYKILRFLSIQQKVLDQR